MADQPESTIDRYTKVEPLAQRIHEQLCSEIKKLGFDTEEVTLKSPDDACYRLDQDPASGEYSLIGDWINTHGIKFGGLYFHANGSFFVEQDVVRPHPQKKHWFVEAVNAWGQGEKIKAEARLLPMPE